MIRIWFYSYIFASITDSTWFVTNIIVIIMKIMTLDMICSILNLLLHHHIFLHNILHLYCKRHFFYYHLKKVCHYTQGIDLYNKLHLNHNNPHIYLSISNHQHYKAYQEDIHWSIVNYEYIYFLFLCIHFLHMIKCPHQL